MEIVRPYRPRWYQGEFETAMQSHKRAFLLYHRRAGKDISCWNFMIYKALEGTPGTYFYILPTYAQGKRVIWNGINEEGFKMLDYIPREVIQGNLNGTEMFIRLINGSTIQIVGAENYDALRGTNPKGVVFSEFAMQNPKVYTEVISPILRKNGGWAIFNTTPLGKNHAYDLWQMAVENRTGEWFTQLLTIDDTRLISRDQIEKEIAEGKSEEIIQQEYYCSFARGIDGTYYGRMISDLYDKKKIISVPYDDYLEVHTAWDLGISDATSIWFYQQTPGGEIHIIDFYENAGEALSHYAKVIKDKPYAYGKHFFPHDVKARELGSGTTREEILRSLGIRPTMVPRQELPDGIQAVRGILPRCWFDATNCKDGIKHLENYRKHYSDKLRSYVDRPLHNEHSHAADAFRYLALGVAKGKKSSFTQDEARQMYQTYALGV